MEAKEEEEIWSWGAGTDGQLGSECLEDSHFPLLLRLSAAVGPISSLACGGAHVLALTSSGKVLSWGRGGSGQLGQGHAVSNSPTPKIVTLLESFSISQLSAGWNHSGFVSADGCVLTCGDGSFGQLGHGNSVSHFSPVKLSFFSGEQVQQIACGLRHSLVLLKGQVYAFGWGKRGQLGEKISSVNLPRCVGGLKGVEVVGVSANGDRSAALSFDGEIYTWGRWFPRNSDTHCPESLPSSSHRFTKAALGWNHALMLTDDGEAYMLGGALSDREKLSSLEHSSGSEKGVLQEVTGLEGRKVLDIAAGAEHSALVTEDGSVMSWGWGEHGQLGLGDTLDQIRPREVRLPSRCCDTKVYCGSGFTFVTRTTRIHPS